MIGKRGRWEDDAACRTVDPDLFFPMGSHGHMTGREIKAAQRVCGGCPVRRECLRYALKNPAKAGPGIWGGLTAQQRRQLHIQPGTSLVEVR